MRLVLERDAKVRRDLQYEAHHRLPVADALGEVGRREELIRLALARHLDLRRGDQVVEDAVDVVPIRDPGHRVGQVAVEPGEEAEPVLPR